MVLALLAIGFTAGNQIHNSVSGDDWLAAVRECYAATPGQWTPGSAEGAELLRCIGPVERIHALYVGAGALLLIGGAAMFTVIAPAVIRRRKRLRPVGPRGQAAVDRLGELATRIGLHRPPALETSGSLQRDAFCFGRPGAPAVALPLGLITGVTRRPDFEPVVLHELAHIKHRDVGLSWLARGFLAIALAAACVPVAAGAVTGDLTAAPDYLWRVLALVGVGWLISRAVLRVREFDADLTALSMGDGQALRAVLAGPTARSSPDGIRRHFHHHPTATERLRVLDDPGQIANAGFLSGFVPATLVCALVPSLKTVAAVGLTGIDTIAWLLPGAVAGAILLAVSVGVDVVRAARIEASTGVRRLWDARICSGAALGAILGQVISPEAAWRGLTGGVPPPTLLVAALLVCGATAAVCGIARAVADRRINWLGCILLTAMPWGFAFWLGQTIQVIGELGIELIRQAFAFNGQSWPAVAVILAMLVELAWSLRRQFAKAALVGVVAAIAGSSVMIAASLLGPRTNSELGSVTLYSQGVDQAALAAVAAATVLALATGIHGAAAGGIAAVTAAVTATTFFTGYLWFQGNPINGDILIPLGIPLLTLPVFVWLAVATAGLIAARRAHVPPLWAQAALAGAFATTLVAVGNGFGPFLAPDPKSLLAAAEHTVSNSIENTAIVEADNYRHLIAPNLNDQFGTLLSAIDFDADSASDPDVADWLTKEVAPVTAGFLEQVDGIIATDTNVANVHSDLVTAADQLSDYLQMSIEYHRGGDPATIRQALEHRQLAVGSHQAWLRGVDTL